MKSSSHTLSFWSWLRKQKDRDDPVGDLARDAIADYANGYKGVRSIGGLRARVESLRAGVSAMQALDAALGEWRQTKGPVRSDVEAVLRLMNLVVQDRSYSDGSVRVVRASQLNDPTPHPRAYLPRGCSLADATRVIGEAGFTKDRAPKRNRGADGR
jgi:hypothetical protein